MAYYTVIDTNVIVSAMLSKHADAATVILIGKMILGEIIPVYSTEMMNEYQEVLRRKKFKFRAEKIEVMLSAISRFGLKVEPASTGEILPDIKDLPFYEVVMEKRKDDDAWLVTGNLKHFPIKTFIVTPNEMLNILEKKLQRISSMKKIVLATGNPNKAVELQDMLNGEYEVKTMGEMGIHIDIVEDGETFEDNALIKVRALAPYLKGQDVIIMADDSGLCVDALDGAPGVYSARYAGEHVTYADNNAKLLREMAGVPADQRGACFVCCVALIFPDGEEWTGRGEVPGTIALDFNGTEGFGYDPLFIEKNSGKTYAQMNEAEKNAISHRGRAVALAKAKIEFRG